MIPILWCDIETTGLSRTAQILEVGLVATDENLNEEGRHSVVLYVPDVEILLSDVTKEMHTANGLIEEVKASNKSLREAEEELIAWAQPYAGRPIGGSSVHTDRTWLQHWMPDLEKIFHYRNFDVSTLRAFLGSGSGGSIKNVNHRAIDDLLFDIQVTGELHHQVYGDSNGE